ncbi:MAG: hypothetical protein RI973_1824 [Bacteroidota bacterium]|jgi:hypothetical protein
MNIWPYIKKLAIFFSPILLLFLLKELISPSPEPPFLNQSEDEKATYFIGSSRVRSGLDPELIQGCENGGKAVCLGINNSTFSHNIELARHLAATRGSKILFIEISPSKKDLPVSVVTAHQLIGTDILKLAQAASEGAGMQARLEIWEGYLACHFSTLNLRALLQSGARPDVSSELRYDYTLENKYRKQNTFLRWKDLDTSFGVEVDWYIRKISALNSMAVKNRSSIRFFLPLTFKTEAERALSVSLYQALPDSLKVSYSEDLLKTIANPDLLYDLNHLNYHGAKVWSNFFCDYISNKPSD